MPQTQTPWAILLTKWSDHDDEPKSQSFYADLFTEAGSGTYNMVDYFYTMSHESLDLTGSEVHGWFTLNRPQTDYVGNTYPQPSGKLNRNGLLDLAKSTASANGVDLSRFYGVVVVMNTQTDLCGWVGGRAALCDLYSLQPSLLGQEMGHGYGLQHSRVDGSTDDYQDPWDTMSTAGAYSAASAAYTWIGPGLNAANMRNIGWLDEGRVWKSSSSSFSQQIELRPLHRHDLPGLLAAELPGTQGGFLVEFRSAEAWDGAFGQSAVFVHRLEDGHSYRMPGTAGRSDLHAGDEFHSGSQLDFLAATDVHVDEINNSRHYAKVTLSHRPATLRVPFHDEIFGQVIGGVPFDGPGWVVINGRPVPVPPRGPLTEVIAQTVVHQTADQIADPIARLGAKKAALTAIIDRAGGLLAELTETETPPLERLAPPAIRAGAQARNGAGRKTAISRPPAAKKRATAGVRARSR